MPQARFGGNVTVGKRAPLERLPMGPLKKAPVIARTGPTPPKASLVSPRALVGVPIRKSYLPRMVGVPAHGYKRAVDLTMQERKGLRYALGVQHDVHGALHGGRVRLLRGASGKVTGTVGPQYFLEKPYRGELATQLRRHVPVEGRLLHHVEAGPDLTASSVARDATRAKTRSIVRAPHNSTPGYTGAVRRDRYSKRDVAKAYRRHDPEDVRQRRLGGAIASSGIAGSALITSGARDITGDTRRIRDIAHGYHVGREPAKPPMQRREGGRYVALSDEEKQAARDAYDIAMGRYNRKKATGEALHFVATKKPAVVTGRAAGKIGAGLGLVGLGATLARRSHSRRWD